ncbi:hypothetical protein [Ureibacillus thermosphaericus]|uniref:hypothetical protein n=1 Tax=Ureibacillus thermosphaericus TaxID=51173 RepID=UPI0030C9202F
MSNNYDFKVVWCPICSQGWVEIVKDVATQELYVMCSDCETEWDNPENITTSNARIELSENQVTNPTIEEIRNINWEKYIINE